VQVSGEIVELATPEGLTLHARRVEAVAAGDACVAFVRPEMATLARAGEAPTAGGPWHAAEVESLLFDGANSAALLREAKSRVELRIALPQTGQFNDLRVGERVVFGFDPARAACFKASGESGVSSHGP
jgi:spermidine/putrescine transport system ATP-binding protein